MQSRKKNIIKCIVFKTTDNVSNIIEMKLIKNMLIEIFHHFLALDELISSSSMLRIDELGHQNQCSHRHPRKIEWFVCYSFL